MPRRQTRTDAAAGHVRYWAPEGRRQCGHLGCSWLRWAGTLSPLRRSPDLSAPAPARRPRLTPQIATQIALAHPKCRVTAIAGSPDKIAQLRRLGCHHVLNYKDAGFGAALKKVGLVDLYFDNGESGLTAASTR